MAEDLRKATPQGNLGRRYVGAYTSEGQGAVVRPGLWPLCREADGLPGVHGQSPARPILDTNTITARSVNKRFWDLSDEEKRKKKFNRAYQRFMLGAGMKGEYRLLTLTTPEEFSGNLHQAWRKFVMRMRRRGLVREYYAVKEWNKEHTCQHIHVVLRLNYIEYQIALSQWKAVTGAVWIHVDKITSQRGMARYLGKYLNKAWDDQPGCRAFWYAYEWIYRKWRTFSLAMYKFGEIVTIEEHGILHEIRVLEDRIKYMNRRLLEACYCLCLSGRKPVVKLVQF